MASGIYELKFSNGDTYIGKSTDLERRWKQHAKSMEDGKHTGPLQTAYHRYGFPDARMLLEVHPDLLDEYEGYFINMRRPELNTQVPERRSNEEYELLEWYADQGHAAYSTTDLLRTTKVMKISLMEAERKIEVLQEDLDTFEYEEVAALRKDKRFKKLEKRVKSLEAENVRLAAIEGRFKKAGFLERLGYALSGF